MTVQNIYEDMLALTLETKVDNTDFEEFVVPHFNLLLQELFRHNNIARQRNGKEPLEKTPRVTDRNEENPYEWQFDSAMVYGLAAKLLTADEHGLEGVYLQMYYAAVNSALPAQSESVRDVYAADYD